MVHRIFGILTALAMAVHSVLGCCCHHAHAHEATGAAHHHPDQPGHEAHGEDGDTPHTDAATSPAAIDEEHPHAPADHGPCECDGNCQFLGGSMVKAPHPADATAPVHLADATVLLGTLAGPRAGRPPEFEPLWEVRGERCAPIATQVWRL